MSEMRCDKSKTVVANMETSFHFMLMLMKKISLMPLLVFMQQLEFLKILM